jgi:hypothetical protein
MIGHLLWVAIGLANSGPVYAFWSGFFGDVSLLAGVVVFVVHKNCHGRGCWRIGSHHSPYCSKHRNIPQPTKENI